MIKNQKKFNNFIYNTKCNIWRISFNNTDKEYDIRDYYSDEYNITSYNNSNTYNGICINELNMYYGELCTMYYVWKNNLKSDIVGFDQYAKQWNYIDFENINKNKIQVYLYWIHNQDKTIINEKNHHDLGEFLYSIMLYIKFYYPQYDNKLDYILFNCNEIRNHINIFICKWELFEQICSIVFGFLEHIMPNNKWLNKDAINEYYKFNFKVNTLYKCPKDSLNIILYGDPRSFTCYLEVIFGSIYNIIAESFESGNIVQSYVLYDCNSIDDYYKILKMYKYNIGNGVKLIIINDPNNITQSVREHIYNNLCVKTNDKFVRLGLFCKNEYEYEYIINNYKQIKLDLNQYIYAENSIEFNKGNYIIKTIK